MNRIISIKSIHSRIECYKLENVICWCWDQISSLLNIAKCHWLISVVSSVWMIQLISWIEDNSHVTLYWFQQTQKIECAVIWSQRDVEHVNWRVWYPENRMQDVISPHSWLETVSVVWYVRVLKEDKFSAYKLIKWHLITLSSHDFINIALNGSNQRKWPTFTMVEFAREKASSGTVLFDWDSHFDTSPQWYRVNESKTHFTVFL